MRLSESDKRMLDGAEGLAAREAMSHLVKLGEAFEADEMIGRAEPAAAGADHPDAGLELIAR